MFEMAASAAESFAARSLVAIVSGGGSWRNEAFGAPPSSVDSPDLAEAVMAEARSRDCDQES